MHIYLFIFIFFYLYIYLFVCIYVYIYVYIHAYIGIFQQTVCCFQNLKLLQAFCRSFNFEAVENLGFRGRHKVDNHLLFCNHFEELQTLLFEAELIINNAPLTHVYSNIDSYYILLTQHQL